METALSETYRIGFYFGYFILCAIVFLASLIENKTRVKDFFYKENEKFVGIAILVFIVIVLMYWLFWLFKFNETIFQNKEYVIVIIIIKILISNTIANEAGKLGRNKILWGILSFFEFHFALIALGIGPKLIKAKGQLKIDIQELNNNTQIMVDAISATFKSGIINQEEKLIKIKEIEESYYAELNARQVKENIVEYSSQLDLALKNGIITQEEFDLKLFEKNNEISP